MRTPASFLHGRMDLAPSGYSHTPGTGKRVRSSGTIRSEAPSKAPERPSQWQRNGNEAEYRESTAPLPPRHEDVQVRGAAGAVLDTARARRAPSMPSGVRAAFVRQPPFGETTEKGLYVDDPQSKQAKGGRAHGSAAGSCPNPRFTPHWTRDGPLRAFQVSVATNEDRSTMSEPNPSYWNNTREGLRAVELRAAGFDPVAAARRNAVVTVAAPYTNAHRCNNRVQRVAELIIQALDACGGQGLLVGTPAVSDALTQGTANAGYSLVSRDLVADCIETGHYAHHAQAIIVVSGCDKSGAAALMPLARTNAFGLVVYPGTSSPGRVDFGPWATKGNNVTLLDYVEGQAAREAGRISDEQLERLEHCIMPGSGTCGAMFTANTMSTIAEAMGMMLTKGASHPADYDAASDVHDDVKTQARASVDALYALMAAGVRPRDIMTMQAFENAIVTAYAMGGSTNMYLHLLAIAREADVPLTIDHILAVGEHVPLIANLQPHGPYAMSSLHQLGGVPVVMKELLDHGFLHGEAMTV